MVPSVETSQTPTPAAHGLHFAVDALQPVAFARLRKPLSAQPQAGLDKNRALAPAHSDARAVERTREALESAFAAPRP